MSQLYPTVVDPKTLTRQVWDVQTARRIPGVGRALSLISGLISQMAIQPWAGVMPLPVTPFLERPDLDKVRPLFVSLQVVDYLLQGNAAHYVTVRNRATGWPAASRWYPAHRWHVLEEDGRRRYWLMGEEVNADDVVHVQRGADPLNTARGVGVVEEFVRTFDRVAMQEERERQDMTGGGVPSVAVIAPQSELSEEELDDAAEAWERKFSGPGRRPGIFPAGTTITPLGWSPTDAEATAARQMSLTDVSNIFNLDNYWLGTKAASHTYKTPAPLFLQLLRTTLEDVLAPFEATWSQAWVPRGQVVRFDRQAILVDDFGTTVNALSTATGGPIMTLNEGRGRLGMGPVEGGDEIRPAPVAQTTAPDPEAGDPVKDPGTPEVDPEAIAK